MKKILEKYKKYSGVLLIILFIIVICLVAILTAKRDYSTICKLTTADPSGDYNMKATYTIIHDKKGNVSKIKIKEKYTELNEGVLDELDVTTMLFYSILNKTYGGHESKTEKKDNMLIVNTTIDLEKLDVKKYSKAMKFVNYVEKDKINKEAFIKMYELNGATCEDKEEPKIIEKLMKLINEEDEKNQK